MSRSRGSSWYQTGAGPQLIGFDNGAGKGVAGDDLQPTRSGIVNRQQTVGVGGVAIVGSGDRQRTRDLHALRG